MTTEAKVLGACDYWSHKALLGGHSKLPMCINWKPVAPPEKRGIQDLLLDEGIDAADFSRPTRKFFNNAVREAFNRGQAK